MKIHIYDKPQSGIKETIRLIVIVAGVGLAVVAGLFISGFQWIIGKE